MSVSERVSGTHLLLLNQFETPQSEKIIIVKHAANG